MLCLLTIRRLKPGAHQEFEKSWTPERWPHQLVRAYHVRNQDDPDEVITVAFFEGTEEEIDAMRDDPDWMAGEERRLKRIAPLEESIKLAGVYEVVEEIVPDVRSRCRATLTTLRWQLSPKCLATNGSPPCTARPPSANRRSRSCTRCCCAPRASSWAGAGRC